MPELIDSADVPRSLIGFHTYILRHSVDVGVTDELAIGLLARPWIAPSTELPMILFSLDREQARQLIDALTEVVHRLDS